MQRRRRRQPRRCTECRGEGGGSQGDALSAEEKAAAAQELHGASSTRLCCIEASARRPATSSASFAQLASRGPARLPAQPCEQSAGGSSNPIHTRVFHVRTWRFLDGKIAGLQAPSRSAHCGAAALEDVAHPIAKRGHHIRLPSSNAKGPRTAAARCAAACRGMRGVSAVGTRDPAAVDLKIAYLCVQRVLYYYTSYIMKYDALTTSSSRLAASSSRRTTRPNGRAAR